MFASSFFSVTLAAVVRSAKSAFAVSTSTATSDTRGVASTLVSRPAANVFAPEVRNSVPGPLMVTGVAAFWPAPNSRLLACVRPPSVALKFAVLTLAALLAVKTRSVVVVGVTVEAVAPAASVE